MHYGRIVDEMIQKAIDYEEGDEKQALIRAIGNQMKKNFLIWNKDIVDDQKIWADLLEMSNGKLYPSEETMKLSEPKELLGLSNNKKQNKNMPQKKWNNQNKKQ